MLKEALHRVNCDYREVLKKERLQRNVDISRKYDRLYNWNLFEYGDHDNSEDIEFGVSKQAYLISHMANKIRVNEHLVKYGDD